MSVSKKDAIHAWHFTNGMRLRDGSPLVNNKIYNHQGELIICKQGYHASKDLLDAVIYAPGTHLSQVLCYGDIIEMGDKLVCSKRISTHTFNISNIILEMFYTAHAGFTEELKATYYCDSILDMYRKLDTTWGEPSYLRNFEIAGKNNILFYKCRFMLNAERDIKICLTEENLSCVLYNLLNIFSEKKP